MSDDTPFLIEALRLARKAAGLGEVPIGAVVVSDDKIVGRGYNQTRRQGSVFAHAEILALKQAQGKMRDFRLDRMSLYVTLEPCLMCLGAVLLSRIKEIHYILSDPTFGSWRSLLKGVARGSYRDLRFFEHKELRGEVRALLKKFFAKLRKR